MPINHQFLIYPALVAIFHLTGCTSATESTDQPVRLAGALRVELVGQLTLEEQDTAFVGSPGVDFVVAPDGMLYVPDRSTDRVYRYEADGRLASVIGRRGSGPGELRGVGGELALGDSLIAVPGYQNFRVSFYHRITGQYVGAARYDRYLSSLHIRGPHIWFASPDRGRDRTVGWFDLSSILSADSLPLIEVSIAPLPDEYRRYPGLIVFDNVVVLPMGDSLLVGTGGLNYLTLVSTAGEVIRYLDLPRVARRGVSANALTQVFRVREQPPAIAFAAISNLAGIWRRPDGSILIYHRDLEEDDPSSRNSQTVGRAYVSVLSPTLDWACVDAEIPYPAPIYPRITVLGDTIYQLDQVFTVTDSARVQTLVRRFILDTSGCDWG